MTHLTLRSAFTHLIAQHDSELVLIVCKATTKEELAPLSENAKNTIDALIARTESAIAEAVAEARSALEKEFSQ